MKNVNIKINNQVFQVPATAVKTKDWNGNPIKPKIYGRGPVAGSLVKQFVKMNFPKVVCRVKSASFANGNSLDVYVSTPIGGSIPTEDFNKINSFANLFEYGRFNGMEDMYESYENSGLTSDNGTEIEAGVKYVHVNNRASFGTVEAILNEVINEGREFEQVVKYYTDSTSRPAVGKAKEILTKLGK